MAEVINIPNEPNITDFLSENQGSIYTPIPPHQYEGKQVIINADRLIFNARLAVDQGPNAVNAAGGDIHLFSQNFISLSTRGSIHLNTEHPEGIVQEENNKNYIMINAPNIFLGMDDVPEMAEAKPISYPNEPAVLGLKNQEFMDKLLSLIKTILERLGKTNIHVAGNGMEALPKKETWEDIVKDTNDEWIKGDNSIGELRELLRTIKSNHVFIKK